MGAKIEKLKIQTEKSDFWSDNEKAKNILKEKNRLDTLFSKFSNLSNELDDLKILKNLFKHDDDVKSNYELLESIQKFKTSLNDLRLQTLFSGEADNNDCFLEINAGAGGTESQDWAEMLIRMYNRWIDNKSFKKEIISINTGDEAGIKSITVKVLGDQAYGRLKTESGVHRLVRISPFDSQKRRHTSFASVWVYPEIANNISVNIENKDIRIDTYRASGAGGQHVNTTDSAIRITHIPSNIVVQCQSQRSQHQNKAAALKMLKSRLYELELREAENKQSKVQDEKKNIGWGNQIRSYVLHPYNLVKDLRSGLESSNVDSVLNGEIDSFILATLSLKK